MSELLEQDGSAPASCWVLGGCDHVVLNPVFGNLELQRSAGNHMDPETMAVKALNMLEADLADVDDGAHDYVNQPKKGSTGGESIVPITDASGNDRPSALPITLRKRPTPAYVLAPSFDADLAGGSASRSTEAPGYDSDDGSDSSEGIFVPVTNPTWQKGRVTAATQAAVKESIKEFEAVVDAIVPATAAGAGSPPPRCQMRHCRRPNERKRRILMVGMEQPKPWHGILFLYFLLPCLLLQHLLLVDPLFM